MAGSLEEVPASEVGEMTLVVTERGFSAIRRNTAAQVKRTPCAGLGSLEEDPASEDGEVELAATGRRVSEDGRPLRRF